MQGKIHVFIHVLCIINLHICILCILTSKSYTKLHHTALVFLFSEYFPEELH